MIIEHNTTDYRLKQNRIKQNKDKAGRMFMKDKMEWKRIG